MQKGKWSLACKSAWLLAAALILSGCSGKRTNAKLVNLDTYEEIRITFVEEQKNRGMFEAVRPAGGRFG